MLHKELIWIGKAVIFQHWPQPASQASIGAAGGLA